MQCDWCVYTIHCFFCCWQRGLHNPSKYCIHNGIKNHSRALTNAPWRMCCMKPPSLTQRFRYSFFLWIKSTHTIECIKHNNCICMCRVNCCLSLTIVLRRVNKFHFSWKLHRIIIIIKKWSGSYRQNRYTRKKESQTMQFEWKKILFRSWANYCSKFTSRTIFLEEKNDDAAK